MFSRFKAFYLSHFSKPAHERVLYQTIRRQPVRKILEIGIDGGRRPLRLIDLAQRLAPGETIRYTAIDLFEARPETAPGMTLKDAHRLLKATCAQVQLLPGEVSQVLSRQANALSDMDLVIISSIHDERSLAGAWFYLPRMLRSGSKVFVESSGSGETPASMRLLPADEIQRLATPPRRKAA